MRSIPLHWVFWAACLMLAGTVANSQERILLEAEEFSAKGDWSARAWEDGYFCATFASDFVSRQAFLGAPAVAKPSVATREISVPADAEYLLFARYACPYMHHAQFTVRIEQRGKAVYERLFGRLQSPKIWPFGGGIQPMANYPWGGGDNMVYEGGSAEFRLHKGTALVSIIADTQPEPAAERQVDLLMLTPRDEEVQNRLANWSYLPLDGLLTQAGDLSVRVTNPDDGIAPFVVQLTTVEHSPYWVHRRNWQTPFLFGVEGPIDKKPMMGDFLPPGDRTPWVQIGDRCDRLNESTLKAVIQYAKEGVSGTNAVFEFAIGSPSGSPKVLRRIEYKDASTQLIRFAIPGDVRGEKTIETAEEQLERLLKYVRSLPAKGKLPEFIGIRGIFTSHFAANDTSQRVKDLVKELQAALVGGALEAGIQVESLGDEIHLSQAVKSPETDAAFRAYLQAQGLTPEALLPQGALDRAAAENVADLWTLVGLDYDCRETAPRLWYHSQVFGYENGSLLDLKAKTEAITKESNGATRTGANYSPHPSYWPKEFQWVRPFKLGALTMPWSEDYVWGIPELSPQVTGYLMDVFRCAAKYHDLPIVFYVMPHAPGNTPRDFRLSYYEALAHGAKLINNYCVTPVVTAYTENYVSIDHLPMYGEVHQLARELGQFDDILFHGKVRPAQVALLMSGTTDLWDTSPNYNHERKAIYYALRHAGIPVDFVTEDDIADGGLADYRVLYISASHMLTKAATALAAWVEKGGVVFSSAGGGLLNEYGETNAPMRALFGLDGDQLTQHDALPDTMHTLPRLRPVEGLRLQLPESAPVALPALATTQSLQPSEGTPVVGQFSNNSPAAVLRKVGTGQALLVGGFPGAAYLLPAIPVRPWDRGATDAAMSHFLPTDFDPGARDSLLWPVKQAGVRPSVSLSSPVVEWSAVDSDRGTAILLMNWTGTPIERLTLTLRGDLAEGQVRSIQRGKLRLVDTGDGWVVTLPLDVTDCITIRPAP